jgi:hypothetical protein
MQLVDLYERVGPLRIDGISSAGGRASVRDRSFDCDEMLAFSVLPGYRRDRGWTRL